MTDPWASANPHMQGLTLLSIFILQDEEHLSTAYGDETAKDRYRRRSAARSRIGGGDYYLRSSRYSKFKRTPHLYQLDQVLGCPC